MTLPLPIAQIAPLHECVPPRLYGGTERVVSFLTEELVRQGHDVTLFASGDSKTSANLVRCCDMALRLNPSVRDTLPYHMIMLDEVRSVVAAIPAAAVLALSIRPRRSLAQHEDPGGTGRRRIGTASEKDDNE